MLELNRLAEGEEGERGFSPLTADWRTSPMILLGTSREWEWGRLDLYPECLIKSTE